MMPLEDVMAGNLRTVRVWLKGVSKPSTYTCYDGGDGVLKEKDGGTFVHLVSLVHHPSEPIVPRWHEVAPAEGVERTELAPWLADQQTIGT